MLHQIFCQQMGLLRQRARSPHIAFLQSRTRTIHIVPDLSHRLLLSRVQHPTRELFQLAAGSAQQLLCVLALSDGFGGRYVGRYLRRGFARSALANHNLPRGAIRRRCSPLAAFRGPARRASIRLFLRQALRRVPPRNRRGLCRRLLFWSCGRSRSLSRSVLFTSHSRNRETQPKRNCKYTGKSHNSVNRIVSHPYKERKGRRLDFPDSTR